MSLQRAIFIFLILASLIGLSVIFVRRIAQATCPSGDPRICNFINRNKMLSTNTMTGIYTYESLNESPSLSMRFEKGSDISRLVISREEDEILDVISAKRYTYLKDYKDNAWWRQESELSVSSLEELPFNPESFFKEFESIITREDAVYQFIQEADCGNDTCYRYQITYPEQEEEEQLFVFFEKNSSMLDSVLLANDAGSTEIAITYANVSIEEPEKVKIAPLGQNLFLDYLERKEKLDEKKDYDYLKQFQQERIEAEQSGTNSGLILIEESPTPVQEL